MNIDKNKTVNNIKLWETEPHPLEELVPLCRKLAAQGSVLLKNDNALPFKKGERVAVFGRIQESYYKSGTGSGGGVNCAKSPCLIKSLSENGVFCVDKELADLYSAWVSEHPFDNGHGWATEPWCQEEMPVSAELSAKVKSRTDSALIILGRTAGEDHDNSFEKGSYYLTDSEEELLKNVTAQFEKTVVVLNVGNLIDLSFINKYNVAAVMYAWQGGDEGADALADVLAGKISPSGKLPDTQPINPMDNPVTKNFGNPNECIYEEDIYVGYRYFETFAKEKVMFPFGFGLTYTEFKTSYLTDVDNDTVTITAEVTNIGDFTARQVIQVYYDAPCGKLGTPSKQLVAFKKTGDLKKGETETLTLTFKIKDMASFDDSGVTGNKNCYVLEEGEYKIYAGTDSSCEEVVYTHKIDKTVVTEKLEEAMPPEKAFEKTVAVLNEKGEKTLSKAPVSLREFDLDEKIAARKPETLKYTGNKGIKTADVANGKNTLNEFVAQLSDTQLSNIVFGEGMNSPKVPPATGGAIGGVTEELVDLGIPACGVTDGPSGLRIYKEYTVTSLPNGYVFASSFDTDLTEKIFEYEGAELFIHNIDTLLGVGMNIHRHPLCGRNFEYFSEDPLLSGKIAAAMVRGISKAGTNTTIKHFCCNNQEHGRKWCNTIVSQRALREIYLKGFEIAVKEGGATAVMTSYNKINGYHAASNYELTQTILRDEWGFNGLVMTDWWAGMNCKNANGSINNQKAMVRAHNDIFMVCASAADEQHNIIEGLSEGYITRGDLQFCAKNIINYVMHTPTFERYIASGCKKPEYASLDESNLVETHTLENIVSGKEYTLNFSNTSPGMFVFDIISNTEKLAQTPVDLKVYSEKGEFNIFLSMSGTEGKTETVKRNVSSRKYPNAYTFNEGDNTFKFNFNDSVNIVRFTVKAAKDI